MEANKVEMENYLKSRLKTVLIFFICAVFYFLGFYFGRESMVTDIKYRKIQVVPFTSEEILRICNREMKTKIL